MVGESQRAASEGSPTGPEHHAEINVFGIVDHAFLQDPGRFVHHDKGHLGGEDGILPARRSRATPEPSDPAALLSCAGGVVVVLVLEPARMMRACDEALELKA